MGSTREFFDEHAGSWDKNTTVDTDALRTMLLLSDISPDAVMLDVGCGTGMLEPYLLRYAPKRLLAVDFAPGMIAVARQKLTHPALEYRCADVFELTPEHIQCDYCFLYAAFPHFPDPERLLMQIGKLLKPGGRLVISHPPGKKTPGGTDGLGLPLMPAPVLTSLLQQHYRLDVIIDNNTMVMVSGRKLPGARCCD